MGEDGRTLRVLGRVAQAFAHAVDQEGFGWGREVARLAVAGDPDAPARSMFEEPQLGFEHRLEADALRGPGQAGESLAELGPRCRRRGLDLAQLVLDDRGVTGFAGMLRRDTDGEKGLRDRVVQLVGERLALSQRGELPL